MKGVPSLLISLFSAVLFTTAYCFADGIELVVDLTPESAGVRVVRQLHLSGETGVSLLLRGTTRRTTYDILVRIDDVEIPPISVGGIATIARSSPTPGNGFLQVVESSADSSDKEASADWLAAIRDGSGPAIGARGDSVKDGSTLRVADVVTLRPGQTLEIVVRRPAEAPAKEAIWRSVYMTGSPGRWTVSLGFGLSILLDGDREYFTRSDSSRVYTIMEEKSDDIIHLIPALFFHWVPRSDNLAVWSWSLTAGLGYDFRNAVVFAGGSVTFHQNITFAAGAVVHQVNRLNRRYRIGEILREDLDPEQLVEERYAINPFFGVSFRLSEKLLGD